MLRLPPPGACPMSTRLSGPSRPSADHRPPAALEDCGRGLMLMLCAYICGVGATIAGVLL
jgi:hypothetical protein